MIGWMRYDYPRTYARLRFYSHAFLRSFFSSFTMLIKGSGPQTAMVIGAALAPSLIAPVLSDDLFALGLTVLALVVGGVALLSIAYQCHFSAGWVVSLPRLSQPLFWATPPQRWYVTVGPVYGVIGLAIAAFLGWVGSVGSLLGPVDLATMRTFQSTLGDQMLLVLGTILLAQSLCGMAAIASVHQYQSIDPLFAVSFSRIAVVGAALIIGFIPILVFAIAPVLGFIGQVFVQGYQVPAYTLLTIHGVWAWAATSILSAEMLRIQIRRGNAYG